MLQTAASLPLRTLDRSRSYVLRLTMGLPLLRAIYLDRTRRLAFSSLGTMGLYLMIAAVAPLWLLAFSPVFWGLPHLVASLRYSVQSGTDTQNRSGRLWFLSGITLTLVLMRLTADFALDAPYWLFEFRRLEFLGLALALLGLGWLSRATPRQLLQPVLLVLTIFVAGFYLPRISLGLLVFGHHFIAFGMWHRACATQRERRNVVKLTLVFGLAHLLIFFGVLDPLFDLFPGFLSLPLAGLNIGALGQSIFDGALSSPIVWCRLVVAFAFGQSVHYFVWLRAIPEQHLPHQTPTSFQQSSHWLRHDLGTLGARIAVFAVVLLSFFWLLLEFPVARIAYISLAAFHGFVEIAVFAFPARTSK